MKCPKCDDSKIKYEEQRNKTIKKKDKVNSAKKRKSSSSNSGSSRKPADRTNFKAKCNACKWEGNI